MVVCSEPTTRTVQCSAEKLKTKTNLTTAGCATKVPERGAKLIHPNVRYLSWFSCGEKNLYEIGIVSVRSSAEHLLLSIPIKRGNNQNRRLED